MYYVPHQPCYRRSDGLRYVLRYAEHGKHYGQDTRGRSVVGSIRDDELLGEEADEVRALAFADRCIRPGC